MKNQLRLGVYKADEIPQSFHVYASNILKYLPSLGIEPIIFQSVHDLPKTADALWDIRSGGGNPPLEFMFGHAPIAVTVHGFAPINLSGWEYFKTLRGVIMSKKYAQQKIAKWNELKDNVNALIAVSEFTKEEAIRLTGVPAEKIYVCHHGVDIENFKPGPKNQNSKPYLLHISNNEPRKNVDRIISAFQRLKKKHDIELLLKLPSQHTGKFHGSSGIKILENMLSTNEIADLYRNALAFVFPSLYEGFGLPILEAMACGCPVITSNISACPEVSGDSALSIDPRDESALYQAMLKVIENDESRHQLIQSGHKRVSQFSWEASARNHAEVFQKIAQI